MALVLLISTGCSSWRVVPTSQIKLKEIAGSKNPLIRATLADKSRAVIILNLVEYPYITGIENRHKDPIHIYMRNIDRIEVRKFNTAKTTLAVALGTAALVVLVLSMAGGIGWAPGGMGY